MATIKSYADISQSKKLAEILPLESVDMWYQPKDKQGDDYMPFPHINKVYANELPCWSLAALLDVLPNGIVTNKDSKNGKYHVSSTHIGTYITADNPVDAYYELILKLHEFKML